MILQVVVSLVEPRFLYLNMLYKVTHLVHTPGFRRLQSFRQSTLIMLVDSLLVVSGTSRCELIMHC